MLNSIKLSICIATYNREKFIADTLDSILMQMQLGVELIVVDGASPDDTQIVMEEYLSRYPEIRYYREQENSGIDKDYDKSVNYALGEYCWLMTDDDLLKPNAVKRVMDALEELPELVVVNAEIRNANMSGVLEEKCWLISEDKKYDIDDIGDFFSQAGSYLSFIGAVVIRRELWFARNRTAYFGTLFIHFGVIFQSIPLSKVYAIFDPLIVIRYGNAMWTSRGFEIWMFKWPQLVWSFKDFSTAERASITSLEPWRNLRKLFFLRATGAFSVKEFDTFLSDNLYKADWVCAYLIAVFPAFLANSIYIVYFSLTNRADHMAWYELLRSESATRVSRWVAKVFRRSEYDLWFSGFQQPSKQSNFDECVL